MHIDKAPLAAAFHADFPSFLLQTSQLAVQLQISFKESQSIKKKKAQVYILTRHKLSFMAHILLLLFTHCFAHEVSISSLFFLTPSTIRQLLSRINSTRPLELYIWLFRGGK